MRAAFSGWLLVLAALVSQTACVKPAPPVNVFKIGDKVQAGPLIYSILEADWHERLGTGEQARPAQRRFLVVHLNVTNSGAEVLSVPGLRLLDDDGRLLSETIDGRNVPSWLGLIRRLKPADTLDGNILFDVEPKSYKLRLDGESDAGQLTLVEMPLRFGLDTPQMPSALDAPVKQ